MGAWQQGWDFGFRGTSRFGILWMVLDPTLGNIRFPLGFHLLIPRRNQLMAAHGNAHFPWISSQGRCNSMNSICSHPLLLEHLCKGAKSSSEASVTPRSVGISIFKSQIFIQIFIPSGRSWQELQFQAGREIWEVQPSANNSSSAVWLPKVLRKSLASREHTRSFPRAHSKPWHIPRRVILV